MRASPSPLRLVRLALCAGALAGVPAWGACPVDAGAMLEQVNRVRAEGASCGGRGAYPPAPSVAWNEQLAGMAHAQAEWLVAVGELRHRGPLGEGLAERARQAGYPYKRVGENLAQGQPTLAAALRAWAISESHCATMFAVAYTEAAIACLTARDGRPLWVMALGLPKLRAH